MNRLAPLALFLVAAGCSSPPPRPGSVSADISREQVEIQDRDTTLRGFLAMPPADVARPVPCVLVVHEWWGRGRHADLSAERLAAVGYAALAVDMFGEGRLTTDPKQAGEWAGAIRNDPDTGMRRVRAWLKFLRERPGVDPARAACIGFCFGGTVSLEAAWSGLDLRGVVSFHGNLTTPKPEQAPEVKAAVLVCHGADDPFVPKETIEAFEQAMRDRKLDWQFASYGGAVHSFTNPDADGTFNPGAKYHAVAAGRAWALAEAFLAERFR